MEKKKSSYLFLDEFLYSPKQVKFKYGSPVNITKRKGDEIWFNVIGTNIKGYVVYPHMFVDNNKKNRAILVEFRKNIAQAKTSEKYAWKLLASIPKAFILPQPPTNK